MTEKITDFTYEEKQNALDEAMKSDAEKLSDIKSYVVSAFKRNTSPILREWELTLLIGLAEKGCQG